MSDGPSRFPRRDRALRAARRRLRLLEIETHRIKAELARLEAEYEDGVADRLTRRLDQPDPPAPLCSEPHHPGRRGAGREAARFTDEADGPRPPSDADFSPLPTAPPANAAAWSQAPTDRFATSAQPSGASPALSPHLPNSAGHFPPIVDVPAEGRPRPMGRSRSRPRPVLLSLAFHVVVLLLCLPLSFATLAEMPVPLLASPAGPFEDLPDELAEIDFEPAPWDESDAANVLLEAQRAPHSGALVDDVSPIVATAHTTPADFGPGDPLVGDVGPLMAGPGQPPAGVPGGPAESAVFFGTRSQGDRFVFVVDNSSSMNNGRLEAAVAELVQCVAEMSPRQSFYVIFVSDRPYPMFYPEPAATLLPATPANKQRLAQWLPRAIRATGRNRELIPAMELAASLRPQAIFFLWDGRIDNATVRRDVMTRLTQPAGDLQFTVHTIGMGVSSPDSEYNLMAIARAHGGTYRRVDLSADRN